MQKYLKKLFYRNFKSSPKFGTLTVDSKNLKELFKERRFLYFTKKGPIEIVINIKHYLSAFVLSLIFIFKLLQFIFFGISTFFNYLTYQNDIIVRNKFTDTEIQALKNIAKNAMEIEIYQESQNIKKNIQELDSKEDNNELDIKAQSPSIKIEIKEKLDNVKALVSNFGKSFNYEIVRSDEVVFNQFSGLANPEMIAMEHTISRKTVQNDKGKIIKKNGFSYRDLPVVPFIAPRTSKLKIIHFNKKLDSEILQLVNVFKSLNLDPENIDTEEIFEFLRSSKLNFSIGKDELINNTSLRFQYLEELKNAIIFLPLKPPMQYYYVSSPYGYRIHPKTKRKQMHYGIDMAGTWQEEVRAPADGVVTFSGRNGSFGKTIKIFHKHGVSTIFGHLHKLKVKKGQYLREGDIIGKMGSTGRAVGAHLHYEIKVKKKSVNPYDFISLGRELVSSSILRK